MSLTFDGIAKIFEEIELMLISSLRRNLSRHKSWEKSEGFNWSAWQAEKLKNIDSFRKENRSVMNRYVDVIDGETRQLMEEQFKEGEELAQKEYDEAMGQDDDEPKEPESTKGSARISEEAVTDKNFFGVNSTKMDKLIEDITKLEKNAETAALRMTDDVYRQTLYKVQLAMNSGSMSLNQAIDSAVKDFLDKGINCIVYKNGRRVNISDYVRMALRTTSARASLQGKAKRFAELGYDTVIVSQYGACSDTCLPWQGKVYIDDVFTVWQGEASGDMGKSNYCGKWFTLLSTAVRNGLFHPNCRHTMSQYIDGVTQPPRVLDEEKIRENYRKEQKQRALENKIRKAKRRVQGSSDPDNISTAKSELREAQRELREYLKENPELKRDYGREKVYEGESDANTHKSSSDFEVKPGKDIRANANFDIINSPNYADKFASLGSPQMQKQVSQLSASIINRRDGTKIEEIFAVDSETGQVLTSLKGKSDLGANMSDNFKNVLKNHRKNSIIIVHNHPLDYTFSVSDVKTASEYNSIKGVVAATHAGSVHIFSGEVNNMQQLERDYRIAYTKYIRRGMADGDARIQAWKEAFEKVGIKYESL